MDIRQSGGTYYVTRDGQTYVFRGDDAEERAQAFMASEQPIEQELANVITGTLLPQLRTLLGAMTNMQMAWQDNDMTNVVNAALAVGQPIAGFDPATWATWGATFNALQGWLETENAALGGLKPRVVLMRRYVAQTGAVAE